MNYQADTIRESGFYSESKWIKVRDEIRERDKMTCQMCGDYMAERYIVDHKIELTWSNVDDWEIAYNPENLWLLCQACHNKKTKDPKMFAQRLFY
ncbi:Phage-associated homing endonuclease [Lactococcus cremoris]|nr:Phage-associated homing endonuclease [Lactococcus cremoris]